MTESPDWSRRENSIAALLPGSEASDRGRLLAELAAFAQDVVREARNRGALTPDADECSRALAWLDRPVFICGHHRSGTTLLQELLDGHPELLVLPSEGTYFSSFAYVARPDPAARETDRFIAEWIVRLIDPNHEPHFMLGRSGPSGNPSLSFARQVLGWQTALRQARPEHARFALLLSLAAAFKAVAAPYSSPRLWVEKTPLNELHVSRFAAFSQARYIHVVRDPRTTFGSLREIYRTVGNRDFDSTQHARAIGRSLTLARKNREQLAERYLVVRYEDLVNDALREMERVRRFLDIASSPALSTPTVLSSRVRSNSSFQKGEAGIVQRTQRPFALCEADMRLMRVWSASAAQYLGYDVEPVSLAVRMARQIGSLPWAVRESLRRFR